MSLFEQLKAKSAVGGFGQARDTIVKSMFGVGLRISSVLITLLFGILFARLYSDAEFGLFVVFQSVATLLSSLLALGLPAVLLREIAASGGTLDGPRSSIMSQLIARHLIVATALVAIAGMVAFQIGAFGLDALTITLICALVLLNIALGFVAGALTGSSRVVTSSMVTDFFRPLLALCGLIAIYSIGVTAANSGLVAHVAAGCILLAALAIVWFARRSKRTPPLIEEDDRPIASSKELLGQGVKIAISAALITLSIQVDVLVISFFMSPEDVAHYFAAARLALFVTFFFGIVGMYAEPKVVRMLAQKDQDQLQEMISIFALTGFAVALASGLAIVIAGGFYLELYGTAFLAALPSLWILVFGQVLWTTFGPAQLSLRAARLDGVVLKFTGIALALNLAVSFLLVPAIGSAGAAIGTSVQFAVLGILLSRSLFQRKAIRSSIWTLGPWRLLGSFVQTR